MKKYRIALFAVFAVGMSFLPVPSMAAVPVFDACGANADTAVCKATGDKLFGAGGIWNTILNTLIFVTGSISVLMIVIGGLRYTLSAGDQGGVNSAKNTILYAVVGLVLSITAFAIVNFILTRI